MNGVLQLAMGLVTATSVAISVAPAHDEAGQPSAHFADAGQGGEADQPVSTARTIRQSADGLFYLTAHVNGAPVRFVVDTGASYVVLRREDAIRAGLDPDAANGLDTMKTVSGPAVMRWDRVKRLSVAGDQFNDVRVAVVRDGLHVSLLGQNALAKMGSITLDGDRLTIGG
jgi:aspartyl protease family protein